MVYLLCFDKPYRHAHHYIGYCDNKEESLEQRIARHRDGRGARLLQVITEAGIGFEVVRTWKNGGRDLERKLKNRKNSSKLCPRCHGKKVI